MSDILDQYRIVFGNVEGAKTAFEFAQGSSRVFVRSQFQIAFDSPQATGSRISALDAFDAFGWDKLAEVGEQGVALISGDLKTVSRAFRKQLTDTGLNFDDVATKAAWLDEEKARFNSSGRAPIRSLQQFAALIGFDERSFGFAKSNPPDPDVAYRMRSFSKDGAIRLSTSLKLLLIEASWIIERQHKLLEMLQNCAVVKPPPLYEFRSTDRDYGDHIVNPWMRGFTLAHFLRKQLGLSQADALFSMRGLVEDYFGIPVILVRYAGSFAGATVQAHNFRGIIINIEGPKSSPLTRRSTLAHELCHIVFDDGEQLKSLHVDFDENIISYAGSVNDDVEKRANAFAVEFLINQQVAQDRYSAGADRKEAMEMMVSEYGIGSWALTQHLANGFDCPTSNIAEPDSDLNIDHWRAAENSLTDFFPSRNEIPSQRLGNFAYYTSLCVEHSLISRDSASIMLRCSIDELDDNINLIKQLHMRSV